MGHSSPSTQSILSPFHSNGSTASAVSQISSSSFNSLNGTESSFSSHSTTPENKSAATFNVTPTSSQMGKTFVAIKMATTSPISSRCGGAIAATVPSSSTAVPLNKRNNGLSTADSIFHQATRPQSCCASKKTSPTGTRTPFDPYRTPTSGTQRAIHPFSTITATSMRRQPTSKVAPNILGPSSTSPALDRKIAHDSVASRVFESSAFTTPKCFAPLACSSFNAPICNRRRIQTAPTRMIIPDSDEHSLTPRRYSKPSRARISLISKFRLFQNCAADD